MDVVSHPTSSGSITINNTEAVQTRFGFAVRHVEINVDRKEKS